MAFPIAPQIVEDLKSNFYWSYLSQSETIEETPLEISVSDFLEYIDIDLEGTSPYNDDELVTLYYGRKAFTSEPLNSYFTYMIANSERNGLGVIVSLGIIGNATQYLLLTEGPAHSSIVSGTFTSTQAMYKSAYIYSPYLSESMEIDEFTNHPLSCSFPKEEFRRFILENWEQGITSLDDLKLVFQMGATYVTSLNPDYKVETAIIITKDLSSLRLNNTTYPNYPYKNKAMDLGALCPPNCNN